MKHKLEADSIHFEVGLTTILSDIYIENSTGEITCLLGRNGAGKTCLLNIVYGQLKAVNSSIRFDGAPISKAYKNPLLIRYLPQFYFLPKSLSLKKIFADFDLSLMEFELDFPEFKLFPQTKIGSLSGGQRRLVEVYTIIKSVSRFAMLDEPFSQLMPLHVEKIKQILMVEKEKKGFIITDHLFKDCIDISDRFYVLKNGALFRAPSIADIEDLGYING